MKRTHRGQTTELEPAEMEELHGRVLGTIGAYGMGDSIDPPEAVPQDRPATRPPEPVRVPDVSHISDGGRGTSRVGHGDDSVTRRLKATRTSPNGQAGRTRKTFEGVSET